MATKTATKTQAWPKLARVAGVLPGRTCPDVTVLAVGDDREALRGEGRILEIYYFGGAGERRPPLVGERLGTWQDVTTLYVMAPRRS